MTRAIMFGNPRFSALSQAPDRRVELRNRTQALIERISTLLVTVQELPAVEARVLRDQILIPTRETLVRSLPRIDQLPDDQVLAALSELAALENEILAVETEVGPSLGLSSTQKTALVVGSLAIGTAILIALLR